MSRTLSSSELKSVTSFSSAWLASSAFWACWLNNVKKMLFFGIRLSRITPPFGRQRGTIRSRTRCRLRDLAADRHDGRDGHDHGEGREDADVPDDERIGERVPL